ncbi:MAG: ABC transporter permease [Oscillospiraceae bacterium]|jgi:peptide/nickel transport system permease protein|nr:ABC transporter permease [Oscillospiraceae bacterium]
MNSPNAQSAAPALNRKQGLWREAWLRMRRNTSAIVGMALLAAIILLAVFANVIADYDTVAIKIDVANRLKPPSRSHLFGTDELGRDLFARIIHGARISLSIGFLAEMATLALGMALGSVSGFYGGRIDNVVMRFMDVFMAIPSLLLAIAMVTAFGTGTPILVLAIAVSGAPSMSRIVRAQVMSAREQEYVEAARALGAGDMTVVLRYILPNTMSPIIVQASLDMAGCILTVSSLSYLGLGVPPPAPEWGAILSAGQSYIRDAWNITVFPGLMIVITVIALNMVGDGLRDALDPKLKR